MRALATRGDSIARAIQCDIVIKGDSIEGILYCIILWHPARKKQSTNSQPYTQLLITSTSVDASETLELLYPNHIVSPREV